MSSNIRFANSADGIYDWPMRKALLADIITGFEPCLLGTQEGRRPQLLQLQQLLPKLKLVDQHRDWIDKRMYPCIFYDPQKIEVEASGDFWLSKTPYIAESASFASTFPRLCTWIKAKFKSSEQSFIYLNTHLDHLRTDTRVKQVGVLFEEVKKIFPNLDQAALFMSGDFNEGPHGKVYEAIFQHCPTLVDPWLLLKKNEESSFHKFQKEFYENPQKGIRIDWILASKQFQPMGIELDKTRKDQIFPSDHYPLKASFKL